VGAATFDIRISGKFVWFATVLCTLMEEKQDTSHMFLPKKRANEIGNLKPLRQLDLRYFNYNLF
jgi:hypothetical protein